MFSLGLIQLDAKVILGGRYELQSRLGEGGMATVYMALDRKLDRKVAVKVLHSHMEKNDEIRHRFHQEAKTISSLNHPNILKIYDFSGVASKKLWIVTEIIHGNSLSEYIQKFTSGSLHSIIAAAIVRETAKALSAAHERGVIHRDIKPENIMLTEKGKVKLMDFGISKDMRDHSVTQTGTFMGSPSYMSPEQVVSGNLDIRTDTYSLGIVFYEILTGRLPFSANTTSELTKKIRHGDFVEPKYLRPNMHEELNDLICDCMATSKEDRPEEVSFVAQQIEHFLARLGFVESHVELERYFKDRVSFEARLRAVESELAMKSQAARARPQTNHLKTEYIRSKAQMVRQKEVSQANGSSHNPSRTSNRSPSRKHAISNPGEPSTRYHKAVQSGSIHHPPRGNTVHQSNAVQRESAQREAMQRKAYQIEMQKRAILARKQRMKAYKRAMEAQAYRRTENIADASALWNGAIAIVVFICLGFGFYELLKMDSRIKKENAEQRYQNSQTVFNKPPAILNPKPPAKAPANQPNTTLQQQATQQSVPKQTFPQTPQPAITRPSTPRQPGSVVGVKPSVWKKSNQVQAPKKPATQTTTPRRAEVVAQETKGLTTEKSPKTAQNGKLKVRSSPAARVYIDGKQYGTTVDLTSSSKWVSLTAGKHEIRLTREGYKDHTQSVNLTGGKELFLPLIRLTEQAPKLTGKNDKDVSFQALYSLIIETNQLPLKVYVKPLNAKGKSKTLTMKQGKKSLELPSGKYRIETNWNGKRKTREVSLPGPGGAKNITYFVSH